MDDFNMNNNESSENENNSVPVNEPEIKTEPKPETTSEPKPEPTPEAKAPSEPENPAPAQPSASPSQPETGSGYSYGYSWNGNMTPPPKKNGSGIKVLAAIMSAVALFAIAALGVMIAKDYYSNDSVPSSANGTGNSSNTTTQADKATGTTTAAPAITVPKGDSNAEELTKQEIIANAQPGVVGVTATVSGGTSLGSGFVYAKEGYIITNYHVVADSTAVKVTYNDGSEAEATLVGGDSLSDVAVLKVDTENLTALTMGNSDNVVAGDEVIAIGTPVDPVFAGTCTHGMVSAVNREISIRDNNGKVVKTLSVIQMDAAINGGNSGGPLLNSQGQVIGINSLKLANGYDGMSFALPINGVVEIANQLISNGSVTERPDNSYANGTPAIGVTVISVTEQEATSYGWPQGAYVYSITPGGAAEESGIKRGDIITGIDGTEITSNNELVEAVAAKKIGDKVTLKIYRDSEYIDIDVTLKESNG